MVVPSESRGSGMVRSRFEGGARGEWEGFSGDGLGEISWRGREGECGVWEKVFKDVSWEASRVSRVSLLSSFGVSFLSWLVRAGVDCFAGTSLVNASPSFSFGSKSGLTTLPTNFSRVVGFSIPFLGFAEKLLFSAGRSAGHGWTRYGSNGLHRPVRIESHNQLAVTAGTFQCKACLSFSRPA